MAETPDSTAHDVVCPHCKKQFTAALLEGDAGRYRGYKCPHCRLFVASDRAGNGAAATDS